MLPSINANFSPPHLSRSLSSVCMQRWTFAGVRQSCAIYCSLIDPVLRAHRARADNNTNTMELDCDIILGQFCTNNVFFVLLFISMSSERACVCCLTQIIISSIWIFRRNRISCCCPCALDLMITNPYNTRKKAQRTNSKYRLQHRSFSCSCLAVAKAKRKIYRWRSENFCFESNFSEINDNIFSFRQQQ